VVGSITIPYQYELDQKRQVMEEANARTDIIKKSQKKKSKMRGKNKIGRQLARKRKNVIDEKILLLREEQKKKIEMKANGDVSDYKSEKEKKKEEAPLALKRFFD
jgi:hypothetical protein